MQCPPSYGVPGLTGSVRLTTEITHAQWSSNVFMLRFLRPERGPADASVSPVQQLRLMGHRVDRVSVDRKRLAPPHEIERPNLHLVRQCTYFHLTLNPCGPSNKTSGSDETIFAIDINGQQRINENRLTSSRNHNITLGPVN